MRKLDTILFDLDGTLIDTNHVIFESFKHTFKVNLPEVELDDYTVGTFVGPTLQQTFGKYTNSPFVIDQMIKDYRAFYIDYEMGNFEIYPYVKEVLLDLKSKGYNLCIVTSKFQEAAWPSFTFYGLEEIFDGFVALDHVEKPKPDRNPIDVALAKFPNHKKAIMIGDNRGDIKAGINAGIYSAGVSWSLKGHEYLLEANPDYMLRDMKDIYRVLANIEEE